MSRWPLTALAVLVVPVSGCLDGGQDLFSAAEAMREAHRLFPDGVVVGAYGVEGAQAPRDIRRMAFQTDGLDDGALGDGRLSSWVVHVVVGDRFLEVRLFADGRPPQEAAEPALGIYLDQQVGPALTPYLDSDKAASLAAGHREAVDHSPTTGWLYGFSRLARDEQSIGEADAFGVSETPNEFFGFYSPGEAWSILRYDYAWVDDRPGTAHLVVLDAIEGSLLSTATLRPLERQVHCSSRIRVEGSGTPQTTPTVQTHTFDVSAGATRLEYTVDQFGESDYAFFRLIAPAGEVVYEGPGIVGGRAFMEDVLLAGTWTIEMSAKEAVATGMGTNVYPGYGMVVDCWISSRVAPGR